MDDAQLRTVWQQRQIDDRIAHVSQPLAILTKHVLAKRFRQLSNLAAIWDEIDPRRHRRAHRAGEFLSTPRRADGDGGLGPPSLPAPTLLDGGLMREIQARFRGALNKVRLVPGQFYSVDLAGRPRYEFDTRRASLIPAPPRRPARARAPLKRPPDRPIMPAGRPHSSRALSVHRCDAARSLRMARPWPASPGRRFTASGRRAASPASAWGGGTRPSAPAPRSSWSPGHAGDVYLHAPLRHGPGQDRPAPGELPRQPLRAEGPGRRRASWPGAAAGR